MPRVTRSLETLNRRIVSCRACQRLVDHREAMAREKRRQFADQTYWGRPVPGFGDLNARLLIVGLAPAAHGANRTGRMFTGDSSGDWLYEALHRYGFASQAESRSQDDGLTLRDCYITAAVRCAPPGNKPTVTEFETCRPYLEAEIKMLSNVCTTLTLGQLAHQRWLKAAGWWDALEPKLRPRFTHLGVATLPDEMRLLSSYHPSRQNTNTGRLSRQMWHSVFREVRQLID
ncbi:MAG: uracil-DNA glycosylase [Gemmatimonadota bacterium]|nr:MAG: uracil-DNA glycosylase [Gemmatimonadota bacterium]